MESGESIFRPNQMNKVIVRTFPDGTLSFFVDKPMEDDENPIPLTFRQETAEELKKFVFGYDNHLLNEAENKVGELAKQLAKANNEIVKLSKQLKMYDLGKEKIERWQTIKSGIIEGIQQLKPNTRIYVCKNGVTHNKDVLVDVEEFREEVKGIVNNMLEID